MIEMTLVVCHRCQRRIAAEKDVCREDVVHLFPHDRQVDGEWQPCPALMTARYPSTR